jgi:hypothetical protein
MTNLGKNSGMKKRFAIGSNYGIMMLNIFLQNLIKYSFIGLFIVLFAGAAFAQYEPLTE